MSTCNPYKISQFGVKLGVSFFCIQELDVQAAGGEGGEDFKVGGMLSFARPLVRIVADNKDISKTVLQLNSIITTNRPEVTELLATFDTYGPLWNEVSWPMRRLFFL